MSLTSQIGSSDVAFKLTQKVVATLADKFGFAFEDGWNTISSRTIENMQKRMKREKRRANPTSSIKHPRTSFSFFTQRQRPISQLAHPTASFGELSRYVSEAWKSLTPTQMAEFKALETEDKARYQTERSALLASMPVSAEVAAETSESVVESAPAKKVKTPKTPKTASAPAPAPAPATPAPKVEKVKSAKAPKAVKSEAPVEAKAPVVVATPAPVEAKAPKTPKAPKATKAEAPVEAKAPVVVATPAPVEAKVAKAPKAPKTPKA